jgi:hypothetical protein
MAMKPHTAADLSNRDAEILARERQLVKIITPDVIPNDDERNNKISYYASSALPIPELEWAYEKIKTINKRIGNKVNSYTGRRVQYNTGRAPEVDENGKTQLERELDILESRI